MKQIDKFKFESTFFFLFVLLDLRCNIPVNNFSATTQRSNQYYLEFKTCVLLTDTSPDQWTLNPGPLDCRLMLYNEAAALPFFSYA